MTQHGVTDALVHALVTETHAEGILDLDVAAAIERRGQALLIASDDDELDPAFELPCRGGPAGRAPDVLWRCLATVGLQVDEVTAYLGHHDRHHADGVVRESCFVVAVIDPQAICWRLTVGHQWADLEDPEGFPSSARPQLVELSAYPGPAWPESQDPPLARPLRASARGLYPVEAGVALLIGHASWLQHTDFTDRFVHLAAHDADGRHRLDGRGHGAGCPQHCPAPAARARCCDWLPAWPMPRQSTSATPGLDSHNAHLFSQAALHANGFRPATSERSRPS